MNKKIASQQKQIKNLQISVDQLGAEANIL